MKLLKRVRIFLLYARHDGQAVRRLYHRLVREGADVWLDSKRLLPGQDWDREIHRAIDASHLVILCLSKAFNKQGGYRHEELRIALEKANALPGGQMFLIPARLEECELPEHVRKWQRVDLFKEDGFHRLLSALRQYTV